LSTSRIKHMRRLIKGYISSQICARVVPRIATKSLTDTTTEEQQLQTTNSQTPPQNPGTFMHAAVGMAPVQAIGRSAPFSVPAWCIASRANFRMKGTLVNLDSSVVFGLEVSMRAGCVVVVTSNQSQ